jgi:pimeloyl-ACP methyl ester carboxylesterase
VKLIHESQGSGEPLVLIHGLGSARNVWKSIYSSLAEDFTVVAVDLPGHGETPLPSEKRMDPRSLADDVVETMIALGHERFHVVGNSLGGWIALEIASAYPERVRTVMGLAPAGLWLTPFRKRTAAMARSRYLAQVSRPFASVLLRFAWAKRLGFKFVSPQWRRLDFHLCLDATNAMALATGYSSAWDGLLNNRFESSINPSIPISIIFGDSDNTLPALTCQERCLTPPHSQWKVLTQSGHAPMWDRAEEVVEEIRALAGVRS